MKTITIYADLDNNDIYKASFDNSWLNYNIIRETLKSFIDSTTFLKPETNIHMKITSYVNPD